MEKKAESNSTLVKQLAAEQGFSFCGISKAEKLEAEARQLENWLQQNRHGAMHYMENHFDKRIDPTQLVPGAKSVVSLMYNYYPAQTLTNTSYKISKYAYGLDYHTVIKEKLYALFEAMRTRFGHIEGRVFVDSAPVMEKAWAKRSGLGWQGKNTNIIHPKAGSFYFLAVLVCDIELTPDGPIKDYCGTCTACIDACPTQALTPYAIDAQKCISYLTIELRDELLPKALQPHMDNWIFGCDVCQDVCPWNRFSTPHNEPRFSPTDQLENMTDGDWEELTEDTFRHLFKHAAVARTKYAGLKRNIRFIQAQ